jgi:hypothetical protein
MQEERIKYRINQMTETGANVSLALSEDVDLGITTADDT